MTNQIRERLQKFAYSLIDQKKAQVIVEPQCNGKGFWFGGGNIIFYDNMFWLCGRYRNDGDSRTGVGEGERGLELAIFSSSSINGPWEKVKSFSKSDLEHDNEEVVSIEGSSFLINDSGVELYISTEKNRPYQKDVISFQKKGTGVWDIDFIAAPTVDKLNAESIERVLRTEDLGSLHLKDPVAFNLSEEREGVGLFFCSHPFTWASSNTGLAIRRQGEEKFRIKSFNAIERGRSWDVACTRITDRLRIPTVGLLEDQRPMSLYFYDGAECLRSLEENPDASKRPRGFSCEEIGGMGIGYDDQFPDILRFSEDFPMFISPQGTGCSRYISTIVTNDGILATWQQSQKDFSQPLVSNFLSMESITEIFAS